MQGTGTMDLILLAAHAPRHQLLPALPRPHPTARLRLSVSRRCRQCRHSRLSGSRDLDNWVQRGLEAVREPSMFVCSSWPACARPAQQAARLLRLPGGMMAGHPRIPPPHPVHPPMCVSVACWLQVRGAWKDHVVGPLDGVRAELFNTYRRCACLFVCCLSFSSLRSSQPHTRSNT